MNASLKYESLYRLIVQEGLVLERTKLSSGVESNLYFDIRRICSIPRGIKLIAERMLYTIFPDVTAIAGEGFGAMPLVTAVSLLAYQEGIELPGLLIRKELKGHGIGNMIEGKIPPEGSKIAILDDVCTTGQSIVNAADELSLIGLCPRQAICVVSRVPGAPIYPEIIRELDISFDWIFHANSFAKAIDSNTAGRLE